MLCAYMRSRYQVSVYRTVGPLVSISHPWDTRFAKQNIDIMTINEKAQPTKLSKCQTFVSDILLLLAQ